MDLPEPEEIRVRLADGRTLAAAAYGDPAGDVTVLHHPGTGSSRWEAALLGEAAAEAGVRLIGVDRPKVGESTPLPGRTLADWPADLLALADHLGADRFVVSGVSGGGPHALAVADAAPDRVIRAVPMNSGPPSHDADVMAALPKGARGGPALAKRSPWLFDKVVVSLVANQRLGRKLAEKQVPAADLALMQDPAFAAAVEGFGIEGRKQNRRFFEEALVLWAAPWPFDPYGLQVPVVAVTGEADPYRPFTELLAQRNADAELVVVPGGHLGVMAPANAKAVVAAMAG